jgi:hypothetical protein
LFLKAGLFPVESWRLLLKLGHPSWRHKFVIKECEFGFSVKILKLSGHQFPGSGSDPH